MGYENADSVARELLAFTMNDGDLPRQRIYPIHKNIERTLYTGEFDIENAYKLGKSLMDNAAKIYAQQYCTPNTNWYEIFTPSDRRIAGELFINELLENHYRYPVDMLEIPVATLEKRLRELITPNMMSEAWNIIIKHVREEIESDTNAIFTHEEVNQVIKNLQADIPSYIQI